MQRMATRAIRWFTPFAVVGWWDTAVEPAARGGRPGEHGWRTLPTPMGCLK